MRWIGKELRKAYYTSLNGNIQYNSINVPVFDLVAPNNTQSPYIILGSFTQVNDQNTKDSFGGSGTINIEVQSSFTENWGGREQADDILNSILTRLSPNTDTINLTSNVINIVSVEVIGSYDGFSNLNPESNYRNIVILQNKYFEI
jgi:hypothetical protein